MNIEQAPDDLERLAALIEETTGNVIPTGQYPHLEQAALKHVRRAGKQSLGDYVTLLSRSDAEGEWRRLLPEITIKESFLFRIPEQFRALQTEILPQLARIRPADHTLRIWSAGCARGEEPATLAMVLAECPFLANRKWEVMATDIDQEALEDARRGVFGARAVAQVPPHLFKTWFKKQGNDHEFSETLRQHIELRYFNFFRSPYLSLGAPFDAIFLRNVLIYFTPESQRRIVERVTSRLAPDGHLFLGHSESLWQLSDAMEPVEFDHCFAYRRRQAPLPTTFATDRNPRPAPKPSPSPAPAAARPFSPTPPAPAQKPPTPSSRPTTATADPLADAARAMLDDHLDKARSLINRYLETSKQVPEGHALSGLLHDLQGQTNASVAAYRAALFLKPELYQIRFLRAHRFEHMNLMARARNEYQRVLTDLGNHQGKELEPPLGGPSGLLRHLLPERQATAQRSRRALDRL